MILVDTSIWADHFRVKVAELQALLDQKQVLIHPYVIGELAMGSTPHRDRMLGQLAELPQAAMASDEEVLAFVDKHRLFGSGVGYLDAHLLVAAVLSDAKFWCRDKRLDAAARRLGIAAFPLPH